MRVDKSTEVTTKNTVEPAAKSPPIAAAGEVAEPPAVSLIFFQNSQKSEFKNGDGKSNNETPRVAVFKSLLTR